MGRVRLGPGLLGAIALALPTTQGLQAVTFAFAPSWRVADNFEQYDWSRLTDVCLFGDGILEAFSATDATTRLRVHTIRALAHSHGTRVSGAAFFPPTRLNDTTFLEQWTRRTVATMQALGLDGINIDFEAPIAHDAHEAREHLVTLVATLRQRLNDLTGPSKQLTFDAAWSPRGIDGRFYNLRAIARHVDYIFVMAYDMRSQMWGPHCRTRANSPLPLVRRGMREYLDEGIAPAKLILGVPWYGYDYTCIESDVQQMSRPIDVDGMEQSKQSEAAEAQPHVCSIQRVPFRGAPCSDAAGAQVPLSTIMRDLYVDNATTPILWDAHAQSPYFDYNAPLSNGSAVKSRHQVRFDDPRSLRSKYALARELALGGVGCWEIDALDYTDSGAALQMRHNMFAALDAFLFGSDQVQL